MAEKVSSIDRARIALNVIKQRYELSRQFKSGEIEQKRKEKLAAGDYPWRIIRYPRIINPEDLGYPIARLGYVTPKTLEQHLRHLVKDCRVVALEHLVDDIINEQPIPEKTVAITFDGGWVDHFAFVGPLVKDLQIPATIFLPTGFIGTNNYFWEDKLMFVLLMMRERGMKFIPFDFFPKELLAALDEISADGTISLEYARAVVIIISTLGPTERTAAMMVFGEIMEHLGGAIPGEPAFMSWEEVKLLKRIGFSFGSLGHRHREIAEFSREDFERDTLESFEMLDLMGVGGARLLAVAEDMLTENSSEKVKDTRACDALFAIKLPGDDNQLIRSGNVATFLRQHISEQEAPSVEGLSASLWI
jgi:peptidoglycan/xylan/chitin deacetylase (PgdA/CDA1 family)